VWLVDLNPARGHEQRGRRPALIVSTDQFNTGPAGIVVVVPMTTRQRNVPLHVRVEPPEGGVRETSFAKCEDVRSISTERLESRWGAVSAQTMAVVADRLRILLDL
jgi:mRNA interferase MazF